MRTQSLSSLALISLVTTGLHAEEKSFHNILTVSRSITSRSQPYQVREGGLVEGQIASGTKKKR